MSAGTQSAVADAAQAYVTRGLCPVPLAPRGKNPVSAGWTAERITLEEIPSKFPPTANVGLLLGDASGLVDVDLDSSEAIRLADWFLPLTSFQSGRASRPRSHFFYNCAVAPSPEKFTFNGECLLELRSNGQQTMAPPSTHPSGETIEWYEATGEPAKVAREELTRSVHELAGATLLVRCYPPTGSRHELALALSGFLLKHGWMPAKVQHFMQAVATVAGDDEIEDRTGCVQTSAQRLAAGEDILGASKVRQIIGDAAFRTFGDWLGISNRVTFEPVEADVIPDEGEIPGWPVAALDGDFIAELSWLLTVNTPIPPAYIREEIVLVLSALCDGLLSYPRHSDLVVRRYLALISENPASCKGESWKRLVATSGAGGALRTLLTDDPIKILHGTGIGSGQYLAKELQENPRAIAFYDEMDHFLKVAKRDGSTIFSAFKTLYESNSLWTGSLTNKKFGGDNFHLSVLMHSTASVFRDGFALANAVGDGLLSRFVLTHADRLPAVPEWEPRDLAAEKEIVSRLRGMIPLAPLTPAITDDAREAMAAFALELNDPQSPEFALGRRLFEHCKVDLLHRCIFGGSKTIDREMVGRAILWGRHQLALRRALWQPDARSEIAAMSQTLLGRLKKGTASKRDLGRAVHLERSGQHELFARGLTALLRSGAIVVRGSNRKNLPVYALAEDENQ